VLQLLHNGYHDTIQLSDVHRIAPLTAERIDFIEYQHARCRFRKAE
jgi:hypothetical protein